MTDMYTDDMLKDEKLANLNGIGDVTIGIAEKCKHVHRL